MPYSAILTSLGLGKVSAAIAAGDPLDITHMAVGDGSGNPTTPDPADTALVNERFRATVNRVSQIGDTIIEVELIVPAASGGWTIREFGIFDADGDMLAVGNTAPVYKPTSAENSIGEFILVARIAVSNASAITITVDASSVVATRLWVTENFGLGALAPGGTTGQLLAKQSNTDGDVHWVDPAEFEAIIGIVTEEQSLAASQTVVTLGTVTSEGLAVYVDGLRLRETDFTVDSATQITLGTAASGGEELFLVQNDPGGNETYLRAENQLSEVDPLQARTNLDVPKTSAVLLKADSLSGIANAGTARANIGAAEAAAVLHKNQNLADIPNTATARANIGAAEAAAVLHKNQNLADLPNKEVARTNLGVDMQTILRSMLDALIPVGEIWVTNRSGNPATWGEPWSAGTWVAEARGKALVGLDPSPFGDPDFDAIGKTIGSKTVTLTEQQMPVHNHQTTLYQTGGGGGNGNPGPYFNTDTSPRGSSRTLSTNTAGGGQSHPNIQPSQVVAVWRRTA